MRKGFFITGTDTGVGKTYVAERIVSALRNEGLDVGVMKPAETGCRSRGGNLFPSDALRLTRAAECGDALDLVNPYRFSRPLAPAVAAQLEGKKIDPGKIVKAFDVLMDRHEMMVVEGAGGIMVPLTPEYTFCDLAREMKLPVVIVARPGLGTINHTLLTVSSLRQKRVPLAGIVINHAVRQKAGQAEKTSPSVIAEMSQLPILGIVRFGESNLGDIVERALSLPSGRRLIS